MKPGFRILALLLFLFSISNNIYSQYQQVMDYRQQLKMSEVLPASPDAAGIGKFGNIPVSYATGVPDISIPIWNIKCGTLDWPVSLSYHAGGIRVDEIASSAGLGWSVNAPGVITRSRLGRPDEESYTEPNYSTAGTADHVYLYAVLNGNADSEQDIFSFNFNGRSGKFVINQDGSVLQIPYSYLKVTYTSGLNSFTITDENGVTYLFDQKEMTSSQSMPAESIATTYNSSWYLSKVEMPDKKNIMLFTYYYAGQSSQVFTTFSQAVGFKYTNTSPTTFPSLTEENTPSFSKVFQYTGILRLSGISFPNGSMVFGYHVSPRQDIIGTGYAVTNRLSEIAINRNISASASQVKKFDLYQSYFYYNPTNALSSPTQYRLRLDSLSESGISTDPSPKKYKFKYNSTPMVPRENYGQDTWGYNNNRYNNPTLLQLETVQFNSGYTIGAADRSVDTSQMKACMLSSITYPTGGTTVFIFEPHVYNTDQVVVTGTMYEATIAGNQSPQVSTTTFIYPSSAVTGSARVIMNMSKYDFVNVIQPSWVSLKDLTTGSTIYLQTQHNPYQAVSENRSITLDQGHNYELKAYVYTSASNSNLTATIRVEWSSSSTVPDIRRGGGLRVKEIKNYTTIGTLAGTELYLYDTAVTLTPFSQIQRRYSEVLYRLGYESPQPGSAGCQFYRSPVCRVYSSGPVYAISTALGSPMLYRRVQKITTDSATGAINGKSEYLYDVYRDENFPMGGQYTMVPLISNDWQNGFLITEKHYKSTVDGYSLLKKIENGYWNLSSTQSYSLRVQPKYIREGCSPIMNNTTIYEDALYYSFPIRTGTKKLGSQIVTMYDDNQNKIETKTYNYYLSNKYDFPTKTLSIDSKGNYDSVLFKHPTDFAALGNVYEKMQRLNIIVPVIEQKSYNNGKLLNTVKSNYRDWYGDDKIIALDSIQASTLSNTLETRLNYYSYDSFNNPLSVSKNKDVKISYIWEHNGAYPVAEVVNSNNNSIAYTSFETADGGGWSGISRAGYTMNGSRTGQKAWTPGSFNFAKSGLNTASTYIVSYWSKSGAYAVNGTTASLVKTVSGWTLYEHKIINPSAGAITVTGAGTIDELRLYPGAAQMKTYTYQPLTGVSSQCDINSNITYYNYDNLGRLAFIQDENANVIKRFCYNYNGQPEACNMYGNTAISGSYMKNCSSGSGSIVTYTVPANTYYASTSIDADNLALADRTANGQAYADANGSCAPTQTTFNVQNSVSVAYTISFTNTGGGPSNTNIFLNPNSSTSVTLQTGTYNVSIQPNSVPTNVNFIVNGYSSYGTSANINAVYMGAGSSVTITY